MLITHQGTNSDQVAFSEFPVPVVGSIGNNAPTSGDVHLYADPGTIFTKSPALYADCEGFEGGGSVPVADRHKIQDKEQPHPKLSSRLQEKIFGESRLIKSAATDEKKSKREFAVTELYPRLLFTFSDVVVFVLRNSK